MALTLEQLRSTFKTRSENTGGGMPNNYYPFWNMQIGEMATVRFLPDANEENPLGFLVEKVMHNLVINGERKTVPCMSMYGEDCPVCKVSQAYYKDDDKVNGGKYWKKKQYIGQVKVEEDPLPPHKDTKETHEGKTRFVALGNQIYQVIKESFESGELDALPFDYDEGTNFIIKKSQQGEYPTYSVGSRFARKSTALDADTVANLELVDLSTLLPKNPGIEKIQAMLEADLSGGTYEEEKGGDDKEEKGGDDKEGGLQLKQKAKEETPVARSKVEEAAPVASGEEEAEIDSILASIRNRKS